MRSCPRSQCPEVQRLPALYVMDLILKTAGAPYPALIHVRIPEVRQHGASAPAKQQTGLSQPPLWPAAPL